MDLFSKPSTSLFSIKDMCMPAKVYFVLALLAVIFSGVMEFKVSTIIFSIVVLVLWTFLLNWICSIGFKGISWALVILPFVGILFTVVIAGEAINQSNRNNPNNLTGAVSSSLFNSIKIMSDQLNTFLGTPGPKPNKPDPIPTSINTTIIGNNTTPIITMPALTPASTSGSTTTGK